MRIKHSLGSNHVNDGTILQLSETRYVVDFTRKFYSLNVIPIGAVRMNRADAWKKRPAVLRYWDFKNELKKQAELVNYELGEYLDVVFFLPMPDSWSTKKKERMNGLPCKVKPDIDNIKKGFLDTLKKNDSDVWFVTAKKYWAFRGSILIYQ